MIRLKSFIKYTNSGPFLTLNEDAIDINLQSKLYMILDGLGGTNVGDSCVKNVINNINKFYLKISGDEDATMPFFFSPNFKIEGNALINAIHYSHKELFTNNNKLKMDQRGATSGIFIAESNNFLTICSVGNLNGILIRDNEVSQLIIPNNLSFFNSNKKENDLFSHPTNAIGLFEQIQINTIEVGPKAGDVLFFLTDGANSFINNSKILEIFIRNNSNVKNSIKEIIDLNNQLGNQDNQSILSLSY